MPLWLWYSQNTRILGNVKCWCFWLMSIYACILFYGERASACVCAERECGCVCQLHDLQCVSVMSCGMLQSHVHGPVTWWCHVASLFRSSPFFSAWSICWQPFEMSIIFITTKTSKHRWLSVKENLPKEQCGMLKFDICFVFLVSVFLFVFFLFGSLCFLDNAYWMLFSVLAAFVVDCFCSISFLFVQRKWWFKVVKDMLSKPQTVDFMPYRSLLL